MKLYFMCGLPGEREIDLDGIVEMAETISRMGKEERGHYATVVANVSNFVPKPQTPYQWNGMQTREYLRWAASYLPQLAACGPSRSNAIRSRIHCSKAFSVEAIGGSGRRSFSPGTRGARLDSWGEQFDAARWWQAFHDCGIDVQHVLHGPNRWTPAFPGTTSTFARGRTFLEKEQTRSVLQLATMADAV